MKTTAPSVVEIQRLLASELSLPSRLGHTLLLVGTLSAAAGLGSLLATEPALPPRTQVAFLAGLGLTLSWSAFAVWVLVRRRVLFGSQRVVAARLAVACSALGTIGMLAAGCWTSAGTPAILAASVEAVFCAAAAVLLARARRRVRHLERRRRELEARMAMAERTDAVGPMTS